MAILNRLFNIINPQPKIGAVEISDSDLRYAEIKRENIISQAVRLPVGVVQSGTIKDSPSFKKALLALRSEIGKRKNRKLAIILNIPDTIAYTQVFSLPFIASVNLEEAARMNLQMISPIDFQSAYAGWQKVGESDAEGGQLEILGAFAQRKTIDDFTRLLEESGFSIVAVEFPSLALPRLLNDSFTSKDAPALIVFRISSNGMSFSLLRKKNLYFNYATAWEKNKMLWNEFENLVVREIQKVINFYASHFQTSNYDFVIDVPTEELGEKISVIISKHFSAEPKLLKNLFASEVAKMNLSSLTPNWFAVIGSALRGTIPRAEDKIISLSGIGTAERFNQEQILGFIRMWRNIIFTSIIAVVALFGGTEFFLVRTANSLNSDLGKIVSVSPSRDELNNLNSQVVKFNNSVNLVLAARGQSKDWSPYILKIKSLMGSEITIQRILIQSLDTPVFFRGRAPNQSTVLRFKDALSQDPMFSDVNLPLSGVNTVTASSSVDFDMSFRIKGR